jgi:hypothetical protein
MIIKSCFGPALLIFLLVSCSGLGRAKRSFPANAETEAQGPAEPLSLAQNWRSRETAPNSWGIPSLVLAVRLLRGIDRYGLPLTGAYPEPEADAYRETQRFVRGWMRR